MVICFEEIKKKSREQLISSFEADIKIAITVCINLCLNFSHNTSDNINISAH